jgi:hypothetical protein
MPIDRDTLQQLAIAKAEDAQLLLMHGRFANAYYLCGFCIEIALKAAISRQFRADELPDKKLVNELHSHDISKLVALAGMAKVLESARQTPAFNANWSIVSQWQVESRYAMTEQAEASSMVEAVMSKGSGVLPWIKTFW